MWDVFISHASEDKEAVAVPLAELLAKHGVRVWFDRQQLKLGDRLRERIDHGLRESRYGVVVLSEAFFSKDWPRHELDGLFSLESRESKRILPIWHGVNESRVKAFSPILSSRLAISTQKGLDMVAAGILDVVRETTAVPSAPLPSRSPSREQLLKLLAGFDPVEAAGACESLLQDPDPEAVLAAIRPMIHRDRMTSDGIMFFAELLGGLGEPAAELLVSLIEAGAWEQKVAAAWCFKHLGETRAAGKLSTLVGHGDFDVQRQAIAAVGRSGRWEALDSVSRVVFSASDYQYGKLASQAAGALGRIASSDSAARYLGREACLELFERLVMEGADHEWHGVQFHTLASEFTDALDEATQVIAEPIATRWLGHHDRRYPPLAAYAMRTLGFRRSVPAIVQYLQRTDRDVHVAETLGEALLCMQTATAASAVNGVFNLAESRGDSGLASALWTGVCGSAHLLPDRGRAYQIIDSGLGSSVATTSSVAALAAGRLGIRQEAIRKRLDDNNSFVRATAALALAECDPQHAKEEIPPRIKEAETDLEGTLYATAAVLSGDLARWRQLHQKLCEHDTANRAFIRMLRPLRLRIVKAFSSAGMEASRHAAIWSRVMRLDEQE